MGRFHGIRGQMFMEHGDMSMEMIVKVFLVVVVAALVLGMLMRIPSGGDAVDEQTGTLVDENKIMQECEAVCDRWKNDGSIDSYVAAVNYCTRRFNYDADGDSTIINQTGSSGYNTYCQDGVHCFNIHECEEDYRILDADTCQEIMCEYYQHPDVIADPTPEKASQRVYDAFEPGVAEDNKGAGTCDLANAEDVTGRQVNTWWTEHFASPDGLCATPSDPSNDSSSDP